MHEGDFARVTAWPELFHFTKSMPPLELLQTRIDQAFLYCFKQQFSLRAWGPRSYLSMWVWTHGSTWLHCEAGAAGQGQPACQTASAVGTARESCRRLLGCLAFQCWQMGPHCFRVSVWNIQTVSGNLHFKLVVSKGNYAINEKPAWSTGFFLYVSFGRARSLFWW